MELLAIIEIAKIEKSLLEQIIPSKNTVLIQRSFKQICEPILKNYNEHITDVVRWCTEKVNKRDYKESMICWPLADNLRLQTPVLTKLVGGTSIVKEFNDNV